MSSIRLEEVVKKFTNKEVSLFKRKPSYLGENRQL